MTGANTAPEAPAEQAPAEPPQVAAVIRVLARILVRLALEEEGVKEPANDNTELPK